MMRFSIRQTGVALLAVVLSMGVTAHAVSAQSLDELLDLEPAPQPARPVDDAPASDPTDSSKPAQDKPAQIKPPEEPGSDPAKVFDRALERMREASTRLGDEMDTGLATQRLQESAMDLMDQVIAEAMKQQQQNQQDQQQQQQQSQQQAQGQQQQGSPQNAQQSQSQQTSQQASSPTQSNRDNQGQTSRGSITDAQAGQLLEETGNQWGNLPPRLREQLLQSMNERFSPIYQQMTEAYYKKLAQEATE